MVYVYLNPDGTGIEGLNVIVLARTGVTYAAQAAGYRCAQMEAEGFLLPVGDHSHAAALPQWFDQTFHGWPPAPGSAEVWRGSLIDELNGIVKTVPVWFTANRDDAQTDRRESLEVDRDRLEVCTEAWVPVITPYGPGVLVFENSD